MIDPETRIERASSAAWREIDGQVAIVSIDVNRVRLLNDVGGYIWKVCDGATVRQIVEALTAEFEVAEKTAEDDVTVFLEDLASRGMVRLKGPQ